MGKLISLEEGWFVEWVSATDTVVGPAMTECVALVRKQDECENRMDADLAAIQARRIVDRARVSRDEWRERVARFNRNGPRGGTAKLETVIAQTHRHV